MTNNLSLYQASVCQTTTLQFYLPVDYFAYFIIVKMTNSGHNICNLIFVKLPQKFASYINKNFGIYLNCDFICLFSTLVEI